jgi:hypothetical protein
MSLSDNLTSIYALTADVTDSEGNYNGVNNGVTFANDASLGRDVALFAAGGYFEIPKGLENGITSSYTISMWLNPDALQGSLQTLFMDGQSGSTYSALSAYILDDGRLVIWHGPGNSASGRQSLESTAVLPVSSWTHVTFSWDGSNMSIYYNGALDSTGAMTALPWDNIHPLRVGEYRTTAGYSFIGKMADFRFWTDRALSSSEVSQLCLETGLVAKYALDTDATDSVSSNDLSASGTVSYDVDGDHTAAFFSSGELVSTNTIDLTGQATVSFWAKAGTSYNYSGNNYESFFRWGTHAGSHFDLYLLNGKIRALHNAGNGWVDNRGSVAVPAGWNHYAITIDPSNGSKIVYLNGVAQALTGAAFSGAFAASQQIWLGNISTQSGFRSNGGRMDDTRIWTRVLSPTEIAGLYSAGAEPYVPPSGEYDFSHGGNISGVVEFISTTDSNGSRTYLYIRNENGSTGLSVTSDPKSYNEFSSIAPISTGITGKPLGGCSGAGGEAFMFTDANKIYKITFGANHIFLLATELAGAHDVQELRYENDSLIACCNNGQIKVSAAGEALSTVLDLSAEYQPGTVAVDIAGASEGWCIISKNSDNTFNAAIVSSDWNTVYKNAQLNIPISALEINYYAQEGLWKASDGSSVVTTDDITNWLA